MVVLPVAMLRLYVEAWAFPELFADIRREAITGFVLTERRRVGQIDPEAAPTLEAGAGTRTAVGVDGTAYSSW